MVTTERTTITVEAIIHAPVEKVWNFWTAPNHIVHWNQASDEWHTPKAVNDLKTGGKFSWRMEAKDGSMGFDFEGTYTTVEPFKQIGYTIADGRKVQILFASRGKETKVTENFEAEQINSIEMQQGGWQAILNNFKKYVEASVKRETLHFQVSINATAEKVYQSMFDERKYQEWTSDFNSTSHYKGSWEKGSKMLFLGTGHDGKIGGMVSRIKENIPNTFVSIEYLGVYHDGKEITSGPEVEDWAGATENYTFSGNNGNTLLLVDLESTESFLTYFKETWPKALNKLKAICEQ